jgi:putative two-component system response regulator
MMNPSGLPISTQPVRLLLAGSAELLGPATPAELVLLGYDVLTVGSAEHALAMLERQKIGVVVADVFAPSFGGPEFATRAREVDPAVAVLVVSSVADAESAAACLHQGAADYLVTPVPAPRLSSAIRQILERRRAQLVRIEDERMTREEVARLTVELRRERAEAGRLTLAGLESIVYMMEMGHPFLAGHSLRVAQTAAAVAAEIGRNEDEVETVRLAGRLHDIGMMCIGDGIMDKQGALTPEEFERVKQHVVVGSEILSRLPSLELVSQFVRSHHERWDGTGYPSGLAGERVPWGARLIGVAEIYDALTTSRPYRQPGPPEQALERMRQLAGTALSPEAYEALEALVRRRRALIFIGDDAEAGVTSRGGDLGA